MLRVYAGFTFVRLIKIILYVPIKIDSKGYTNNQKEKTIQKLLIKMLNTKMMVIKKFRNQLIFHIQHSLVTTA